jgi:3,4-dihydroxy 2-butanone 4-phosphate synthase / GTP cyclohydrolase II
MSDQFVDVPDAIETIARGEIVIVCDDEDHDNEGDLTMAAELVTPEDINFMIIHGRGLICLLMSHEMVDRLGIHGYPSRPFWRASPGGREAVEFV